MTCEQSRWQLNALADGALPPFQAWQVRRHLAQCAACAADFTRIVQLSTDARAWRDSAPPAALAARIASALPPQTARLENTAMILERPLPIADPPHRFRTRKVRVALALGVCLASVLTLALWPSKQAPLPAAYADTVLAMQRVRTAAWTQTITIYNPNGSTQMHQTRQIWVRRDPPAIATVVPPDPTTQSISGGYRELLDAQGLHRTNLDGGKTIIRPLQKPIADQVRDTLNGLTSFNAQENNPLFKDGSFVVSNQTPWKQKQVILNSQVLLRFRKDITATFPVGAIHHIQEPLIFHKTVWVDPQTQRVQQGEWQVRNSKVGGFDGITYHFVYDQPALAGVFDDATYSAARLYVPVAAPSLQGHSVPAKTRKP